ncbi:protein WEAK CHLOROPLAST MOVEMENT UNDER BLUE LIGHT-like 1 [Arachis stenosperma]|uniref:protein WEAK CHLOROPLAST MOVEMENT UNDER BLUE LIGHT-like 1 n=1 Tax=Arachis stenosperma TaxID=217475 RepID=UPI0025AD4F27|nr:protein WEAK CHLOROPLAST MOVEMENT UNDER BLUE LIGHT-like 1 [Arachis stenosperma]
MEPAISTPTHNNDFSSTIDTTRPFTSVKEAVAIFGERLLVGDMNIYSPKPFPDPASSPVQQLPQSPIMKPKEVEEDNGVVLDTLKKLEAELEKTKAELKLLKERGSETEVALATLNAELHKNMSKLAQAEAAAAGKAAAATKTVRFEIEEKGGGENNSEYDDEDGKEVVEKKKEYIIRKKKEDSKTLAHILSLGENDHLLFGGGGKRKSMKQKPIIPLVGDLLFFKRKSSSTNPLYASPF